MSFGKGDFGGTGGGGVGGGGYNDGGYSTYSSGSAGRNSSTADYNRLTQSIGSNIQKISQNVREIERIITRLGTSDDNKSLRAKLDEVQHYTNQLAKDTNRMLKDLSSAPPPISPSDQRQQRMQKERFTSDFTAALNQFQRVQREAAQKEREGVKRVRAHSGLAEDYDEGPNALINWESSNQPQAMQQSQFQQEDFEALKERESQLKKLESDIVDVNTIFKDLATMVHEQGDMIDSIEANVESAEVHVDQANTQLVKASTYQSKARRKKIMIVICCVVLLAIIGIIIYFAIPKN
ncbi:syntaxin-7-like isoform X1 [Asterias rubens]|uniref:syntaxin-7-like isoform X1 n=1 Tax=Asterias rubens TaxID=7604 RepID=UPI001455C4F7|nr:syntaxin-7-like isoform X1 [Asterias rubens]XP_033645171.1 syntaxin-7-like isoform X1 [Asterias rubens]XP_033645172.1 syntaxin-7-like isoform X1 [Asterias rubens]XP_033645173.1 syntaxin-7-like isoform X1 [Asterias rubens]